MFTFLWAPLSVVGTSFVPSVPNGWPCLRQQAQTLHKLHLASPLFTLIVILNNEGSPFNFFF